MTHTWDWLFVILPKDDKRKIEVLRNIEVKDILCNTDNV